MAQDKKHIDQFFKGKLRENEVAPPASAWESIANALDAKQRKAAILLYRWIGSAAAILLLGILSFYFIRSEKTIEPVPNKMAQESKRDSLQLSSDSNTLIQTENRDEKLQFAIRNENVSPSRTAVKNDLPQTRTTKRTSSQATVNEINTTLREALSLLEIKSSITKKINSLYAKNTNPFVLVKAKFYKRMLATDSFSSQKADYSAKQSKKSWSIGLAFAPTSVGRYSGSSNLDNGILYADVSEGLSQVSNAASGKDLPAYSGGLNIEYQLSERWSLQSGLYYLKQGQQIANFGVLQNDLNASNTSNSYFGNISFDNIDALTNNSELANFVQLSDNVSLSYFNGDLTQQFDLLEIPFLVNYKIINRKTVLALITGINPSILIGNRVYLSNNGSHSVGKTESVNTMIYKSVFGFSFEYPLSRRLYFNLSPAVKYQLNNFNKNAVSNENLQYFEFKTGLNYRF